MPGAGCCGRLRKISPGFGAPGLLPAPPAPGTLPPGALVPGALAPPGSGRRGGGSAVLAVARPGPGSSRWPGTCVAGGAVCAAGAGASGAAAAWSWGTPGAGGVSTAGNTSAGGATAGGPGTAEGKAGMPADAALPVSGLASAGAAGGSGSAAPGATGRSSRSSPSCRNTEVLASTAGRTLMGGGNREDSETGRRTPSPSPSEGESGGVMGVAFRRNGGGSGGATGRSFPLSDIGGGSVGTWMEEPLDGLDSLSVSGSFREAFRTWTLEGAVGTPD